MNTLLKIDDTSAQMFFPFGAEEDSMTVYFDPQTDLITKMTALRYFGANGEKEAWRVDFLSWQQVDGMTIPARSAITWEKQGKPWSYWDITGVAWNVDLSTILTTHCIHGYHGTGKGNTMKPAQFAARHPYWFVAILEIVTIVVYFLVGTVAHFTHLSNEWLYGSASLILSVIAALLLTQMGWWKVVGFRSPNQPRDLWYFALPLLPVVINLVIGLEYPACGALPSCWRSRC